MQTDPLTKPPLMKYPLALGLLAAVVALPVHAGTVFLPYATDEVVGSVRYHHEVTVTNYGNSPARIRTLFVSADGVSRRERTTTVPAHGSSSLASAAPAGAHGHLEVIGPPATGVSARLIAFGHDGRLLSSAIEPVVSDLIPAKSTIYIQGLAYFAGTTHAVTRLHILTARSSGSCSLAAYSGRRELGSTSVTGAAALSREYAEPLQALGAGSIAAPVEASCDGEIAGGPWLAVNCDTPAYAYAAVLATDGSNTHYVIPSLSLQTNDTCVDPVIPLEELEKIPTARSTVFAPPPP